MEFAEHSSPPAWVLHPSKLAKVLNHNMYHSSEFDDSVSVAEPEKFAAGVRSFMYWRRQLAPSLTGFSVMFALLSSTGMSILNVMNVMAGALKAYCLKNAIEFSQGANSHFLAISFKTVEDATAFRTGFKYFGDNVVAYVNPIGTKAHHYSMLWLPPLFGLGRVRSLLSKYSSEFSTIKGSMNIGGGHFMPSSVVRGTMELKEGVNLNDLPHLIPLPAPHVGFALLIIEGREPFCLRCLRRGHLRKNCDRPRCKLCKFYHFPSEICDNASYAARVSRSPGASEGYCWVDDVTDPSAPCEPSIPVAEKSVDLASVSHSNIVQHIPTNDVNSLEDVTKSPSSSTDDLSSISVVLPSNIASHSSCVKNLEPECGQLSASESSTSPILLQTSGVDTAEIYESSEDISVVADNPDSFSCSPKEQLSESPGEDTNNVNFENSSSSDSELFGRRLTSPDISAKRLKRNESDEMETDQLGNVPLSGGSYDLRSKETVEQLATSSRSRRKGKSQASQRASSSSSKKK